MNNAERVILQDVAITKCLAATAGVGFSGTELGAVSIENSVFRDNRVYTGAFSLMNGTSLEVQDVQISQNK